MSEKIYVWDRDAKSKRGSSLVVSISFFAWQYAPENMVRMKPRKNSKAWAYVYFHADLQVLEAAANKHTLARIAEKRETIANLEGDIAILQKALVKLTGAP